MLVEALTGRSIVMIGMMAAGKSRMGRLLAAQLRLPFVDLDTEIEVAAGLSVSEIFSAYGEPEFRRLEEAVLRRLLAEGQSVLALGGGAWMSPAVRAGCQNRAVSIWLDTPLALVLERAARSHKRPLLAGQDLATRIADLSAARRATYALADIAVPAGSDSTRATLDALRQGLGRWSAQSGRATRP